MHCFDHTQFFLECVFRLVTAGTLLDGAALASGGYPPRFKPGDASPMTWNQNRCGSVFASFAESDSAAETFPRAGNNPVARGEIICG